jgi:hypothetical protein
MSLLRALGVSMISCVMFLGCEKSDTQPATPTAPPKPTAGTPAEGAQKAADAAGSAISDANRDATAAGGAAAAKADDASAAVQTKAQELLDQTMTYVKENKFELAEKALTQLDGMKAQLPAEWGPRIEQARSALNAAKASGAVKVPGGLPGQNK